MAEYESLVAEVGRTWIAEMKGRPHWAKYWQNIPGLDPKNLLPQANLDSFNAIRRSLDSTGMFLNGFLRHTGLFN